MRQQILAVLGALPLVARGTAGLADTDAQKLATVRQMIEAWNTRNWQQVYDLFAQDGVLQSMMLDEATVGREAIASASARWRRTSPRSSCASSTSASSTAWCSSSASMIRVSRHHGAVPVVGVVEVEQGRVKAWREYYDRAQMIEAMGLKQDFDAAHGANERAATRGGALPAGAASFATGGKVTSWGSIVLWQ